MRQSIRITFATLATALAVQSGAARAAPQITICHLPPDDPGTMRTIRVSIHDWPDHKSHGDVPGACRVELGGAPPARGADGSLDADAPESGDDGPAAVGGGEFEAVLCDDRSGDHGRLIEVSETGRVTVRAAECG